MSKDWKGNANVLERFQIEKITRDKIHGADYNPRKITEAAKKKLKKSLKEHGLVTPIIVNRRTMNIVGGHQRISILDDAIGKPDYELTIAFIDCDEKEEATLNVQMNNQAIMGEWDVFALQDLHEIFPDIDYIADMGFDASDIDVLFGEDFGAEPIAEPFTADNMKEAKEDDKEAQKQGMNAEDFRAMKKAMREKAKAENEAGGSYNLEDSDYVVQFVFPNNHEKQAFMRKIHKDPKEKFVKSTVLFDRYKQVYNLSIFE